jgi:hypothetical protein
MYPVQGLKCAPPTYQSKALLLEALVSPPLYSAGQCLSISLLLVKFMSVHSDINIDPLFNLFLSQMWSLDPCSTMISQFV